MFKTVFYISFGFFSLLIGLMLAGWLVYKLYFLTESNFKIVQWRGLLGMSLCMTGMGIIWLRIGTGKLKRSKADQILKTK